VSAIARKANPLRSGISWQLLLVEGLIAGAIGIYILMSEESARRNIVLVLGIFLLVTGLSYALEGFKLKRAGNEMNLYRFIAAGFGVVVGLVVILDRMTDFISTNTARGLLGGGLLGIGIATLAGIVMVNESDHDNPRTGLAMTSLAFAALGGVLLYQALNNTNSTNLLGWTALIVGVALVGIAMLRRQRSLRAE
jgi:uncharacterized membrane protein HdeD (DUF308 family)